MSLNISRRDFIKLSAVTAVAVAGSGLLTGCQDPNNPTRKGTGSLTVANATANLTEISTSSGVTAKFTIKNTADNPISIRSENFSIFVGSKEYTGVTVTSGATNALAKGKSTEVVITLSGVSVSSGDTVKVTYWPRTAYPEVSATWIFE